jgi:hypothetical protein
MSAIALLDWTCTAGHDRKTRNDMSDGFKTDTDVLRQAGRDFTTQFQALSTALANMRSGLPDVVSMCGDDEQGRKFMDEYRPYADKLQQVIGDMATGLGSIGQGLPVMADNIDKADNGSQA